MNNKKLKILCANIRSLNANYNELLLTLQSLSEQGLEYDMIALSETWVKSENLNLFPIRNYVVYNTARMDGRRSGGVVLFVKNNLEIVKNETVDILRANVLRIKMEYFDEHVCLDDRKELSLYLLYRDCSASKELFVESLEQVIKNADTKVLYFLAKLVTFALTLDFRLRLNLRLFVSYIFVYLLILC